MRLLPDETVKCPIHSDICFKNIIFSKMQGMFLIDFSDLRFSYLEDDLGRFFQCILYENDVNIDVISSLIARYEKNTEFVISKKNLCISILFNVMYRYFFDSLLDKESDHYGALKKVIASVRQFYEM